MPQEIDYYYHIEGNSNTLVVKVRGETTRFLIDKDVFDKLEKAYPKVPGSMIKFIKVYNVNRLRFRQVKSPPP